MNRKHKQLISISSLVMAAVSPLVHGQALIKEDFTRATTDNNWYFFNGACLTASTAVAGASPGSPPGCTADTYYTENLVGGIGGVSGSTATLPDPAGQGALRFTNGYPGGYSQNGAIISATPYSTTNGLNITFATITYRGDSSGNGGTGNNTTAGSPGYGLPISAGDGADGMSFFLLRGDTTPTAVGSWGGSLGYTCSNANPNYTGMPKAFLGLGIDEYGNFLNPGDNTASGPGLQANRIGLRGSGDINFNSLSTNSATSTYYPSSLTGISVTLPNGSTGTAAQYAVYDTCHTGTIWDYSKVTSATNLATNKKNTGTAIADYAAIPNGYTVLSGVKIAKEYSSGGYARNSSGVAPIYYRLKITPTGLLSLQYSYNGGAYSNVLQNFALSSVSGALPATLYFGFGGSTGGSNNIHEILCFQAAPNLESSSSTSVNQKQAAQLNTTTQAYFAYYNPNIWTGRLTANGLSMVSGTLTIATTPTWDAYCVLTGATAAQCKTGVATTAQGASNRQILTWNGSAGASFEPTSGTTGLSAAQTLALTTGDSTNGVSTASCAPNCRLNFLRGDQSQEVTSSGSGLFRDREDLLADIIDSSPVWVGPPNGSFPTTLRDRAHPTSTLTTPYPENTGQSYTNYSTVQELGRTNVVYVGANDGMLHGFRAGQVGANGVLTGSIPNDGQEVMAYMPGAVIASAATSAASAASGANNCSGMNSTLTQVQNIHGAAPLDGLAVACYQPVLDYSNTQYGHNFFVDATPGTGDLFYNGVWHTWLVGGLGPGGSAIYALDITDPTASGRSGTALTEANASAVVLGEWTPSTISCSGNSSCGNNLGQVGGAPIIRRLHNGQWGVIFGNGINSSSGDAGIFVMVIPQTGVSAPISPTIYYLSTGTAGGNGISAVASADLDGDGITDYVYAGDLLGNVWRFDLTSVTPTSASPGASWAVSSTTPLFKTGGLPITTQLVVAGGVAAQTAPQVMIAFGTGQKFPVTNTSANTYAASGQKLFGFWDWNMSAWNTLNPAATYASMTTAAEAACVTNVYLSASNLQAQTIAVNSSNSDRDIATNATVLWPTTSSCSASSKFGWTMTLPGTQEQIIYNPQVIGAAFQVNSIIPAGANLLTCNIPTDTGFSYAVSMLSGGAIPNFFQNYTNDASGTAAGVQTNATGTSAVVNTSQSQNTDAGTSTWLVYQTTAGTPSTSQINPQNNITGQRLTWKQLR
jgi:type IV pilus assembly protein PilY1